MDVNNLIRASRQGNKEAYGKIYLEFRDRIYRFIFFQIYDEDIASDIMQDIFLKAWKNISGFSIEKKGTFQSYLFTIARNLVIDFMRKKKTVPLEHAENIAMHDEMEKNYDDKNNEKMIHETLKNLDSDEKQIVIMRYFEELSYKEIATAINENEGALRVKLHRTLQKMKKQMEGDL